MVDLAESVGKGEVNIDDMYPARDRKLIELGILSKSKKRKAAKATSLVAVGVSKRPSVASDAPGLMENLDVTHDAVAIVEITEGDVLCSGIQLASLMTLSSGEQHVCPADRLIY